VSRREPREKDEGRGEKGKWGMESLIPEASAKIKTTDPL